MIGKLGRSQEQEPSQPSRLGPRDAAIFSTPFLNKGHRAQRSSQRVKLLIPTEARRKPVVNLRAGRFQTSGADIHQMFGKLLKSRVDGVDPQQGRLNGRSRSDTAANHIRDSSDTWHGREGLTANTSTPKL